MVQGPRERSIEMGSQSLFQGYSLLQGMCCVCVMFLWNITFPLNRVIWWGGRKGRLLRLKVHRRSYFWENRHLEVSWEPTQQYKRSCWRFQAEQRNDRKERLDCGAAYRLCRELQGFSFQDPCWDVISGDAIAFVSNRSPTLLLATPIKRHIRSPHAIIYFGPRQTPLLRWVDI